MVICSTWLLGSGTLPTRMSRAVSMRRLVSVSSMVCLFPLNPDADNQEANWFRET